MTRWNSSAEPMARPPETTILAAVSSGRADLTICWSTKLVFPAPGPASTVSTAAEPPSAAALKLVARTVITFLASEDWTVSSALPA